MLNKILFYLIILPISRLPFWVLYRISDFLYFILYLVFGYRKKVVGFNLQNSFPEKSSSEIHTIEKAFYKHLCDLVVESLKAFSISKEQANSRMKHKNPEIFDKYYREGKSVVLVGGHYGNWELYAVSIAQQIKHRAVALYTPLKNKYFNKKILKSRSKFGLELLPIHEIKKRMVEMTKQPTVVMFAADQSPRKSQRAYWMEFLNQDTGVQFGTEKFAKDYDLPVIFGNIYKRKRGYYEVEYSLLTENPTQKSYGEITHAHTKQLEKVILQDPRYWLWSHKRWKHKRPENQ